MAGGAVQKDSGFTPARALVARSGVFVFTGGMQRIYACGLPLEKYLELEGHRQVIAETACPNCGKLGGLHRHGAYERGITTELGQVVVILIARFLCRWCAKTISYLPQWALSYRLLHTATVEAFLDGRHDRRDVQKRTELLQSYRRRMLAFAVEVIRVVGSGLGLSPPAPPGLWPWLREACGGLAVAARQLVTLFRITTFKRYQCHQPSRLGKTAMGSDEQRKGRPSGSSHTTEI